MEFPRTGATGTRLSKKRPWWHKAGENPASGVRAAMPA
jgi:hypothetical protein